LGIALFSPCGRRKDGRPWRASEKHFYYRPRAESCQPKEF
jgi:hypothetical protein